MKIERTEFGEIVLKKLDSSLLEYWEELCSYVKTDEGYHRYKVYKGRKTDLGSIPNRAKGLVNDGTADDDLLNAYLIHDENYKCHYMSKSKADDLLFKMMKDCKGVDSWDRYIVKYALKWFGGSSYNKPSSEVIQNRALSEYKWSAK